MDNAVIYARYSSSHQREESIEGQIRECTAYAARQGLQIIQVYIDRAISGRTDERPQFQQMIEDSKQHLFSNVIVYTFDRFGRDRYLHAVYKHKLKKNGVRVLSAKEHIDNSPGGVLMESVLEGMAEYYSLELAQKVKRGQTENALAGKWTSGPVPWGFARDENKRIIKHPTNNYFLQKVCEMYANGATFVDLQNYCKEHGVKNNRGNDFNKDSFARILAQPMNIGLFKWNDVVIEDYIEPTIPKEMFKAINKRLDERKWKGKINVNKSERYALTPRFHCAECGGMMNGMSAKGSAGEQHFYYVCANKRRKLTDCDIPPILRDELEDAIYEHALSILSNPANIEAIAEEAIAANNAYVDNELIAMQQRERELKKIVENLTKAIEMGTTSITILQRIESTESELKELQQRIQQRKLLSPSNIIEKQHVVFFLTHIAHLAKEEGKEKVLRSLVNKVAIQKQKDSNDEYIVTVRYNYSDTATLKSSQDFLATVRKNSQMVMYSRVFAGKLYQDGWQISFIFHRKTKRKVLA